MPTPRRSLASVLVLLAAQAVPLLVVAQAAPAPASAQTVPTPEEHFGFAMGTDKRLARWDEILAYFTKVADGSGRVRVDTLGPTTLGNPFVVVTLSSPQNLSRLEAIRAASARIAEGRIERSEAERIAADLPATVVVNHNIHSTEIGASQTSVDLVHRLATAEDPVTRTIVENVVTVLIPSANPDGQIMVTDWYRRNVGTDFEQARMPWLYHPYAGHDNNRDFFQANLVETRYWMEVMFRTAYPQVYLDQHQMGTNGPRIFVPPYPDPMNPDVHPLQWQELKFMGGRIVADLQAAGKQGVITNALYRIWGQEGALTGRYHNIVALLTETASANVASPDTVARADLERSANRARDIDEYGFSMDFVSPWWGGEWTLGDIVEYQTIAAVSLLEQTARFRERYVLGRWQMAAETLERAEREGPWAYVIPADQADPANAADLVRRLALQGIEVHRADAAFAAVPSEGMRVPGEPVLPVADATAREAGAAVASDTAAGAAGDTAGARADAADSAADSAPDTAGAEADTAIIRLAAPPQPRTFPAGSWVVLGAQPARAAVLDLLQPVARRLQREYPGGPFLRSYDAAAYTMPLQMGVEAARVDRPVDVPLTRVERVRPEAPPLPRARRWYALPTSANRSFQAANRLLAEGVSVSRTPGHFLVPAGDARAGELLEAMRTELALHVEADPRGAEGGTPLRTTRIGLYQGWAASMDEGWTRFLLEDYDFDVSV
ncbi:MAG TPA: M14 family zinc carboxypeptidase, partial [Longimicrobiales bacterium]|nr:M14 family zinc carboxypeptidase [Longimicrobiales bacterium]